MQIPFLNSKSIAARSYLVYAAVSCRKIALTHLCVLYSTYTKGQITIVSQNEQVLLLQSNGLIKYLPTSLSRLIVG